MNTRSPIWLCCWLLALTMAPSHCVAKVTQLKIGQTSATWKGLPSTDGKRRSLNDYADAKWLVVVFFSEQCYASRQYGQRLQTLVRTYCSDQANHNPGGADTSKSSVDATQANAPKGRDVAFVAINPDRRAKLKSMRTYAASIKLSCDYLHDDEQRVARALGATRTPEVFVLDAQRRLVYHGGIDDSFRKPRKHYLGDALKRLTAGQRAAAAETPAMGCAIRYH